MVGQSRIEKTSSHLLLPWEMCRREIGNREHYLSLRTGKVSQGRNRGKLLGRRESEEEEPDVRVRREEQGKVQAHFYKALTEVSDTKGYIDACGPGSKKSESEERVWGGEQERRVRVEGG